MSWVERSFTEVDAELLQGVPLSICLSGWAQHWASSAAENGGKTGTRLSRPTNFFDAFLSHDWETTRWLKLLSLLILFNARAAVVGTVLVSLVLGVLLVHGYLPTSDAIVLVAYGAFIFFLCFWQRVRALLCCSTMLGRHLRHVSATPLKPRTQRYRSCRWSDLKTSYLCVPQKTPNSAEGTTNQVMASVGEPIPRSPRIVFLDKLCIDQEDYAKKEL
ncbi:unnamed protein product [Symbiodinium natans]|uniref:Uncharacterized protein n=1 Tax=Symbiodinium natans TaxID=878477 RepID=A0A812J7K1_9DINO|nr:unnamed protein product [Symbiodinium natans]